MYDGVDLSGLTNIQSSTMSWDYIKRLRDVTKMKIVLKGILAFEDAKIAADSGIDAIIVSNHGGRSDEAGRSTIDSLPEIIEASGSMPVLIDSGFRRGTDIVKALCMGAKGVAVGRPYLWGLGAFGEPGVERVLELLRIELRAAIQQVRGGIAFNEHLIGDGATIFRHACKLGFEGIVSKHREHAYRSGPSKSWLKVKNPASPAMLRLNDGTLLASRPSLRFEGHQQRYIVDDFQAAADHQRQS